MLIRAKKDFSFRSRGPVGMPAPHALAATSTFNGIYMRPNSSDDGSVPAGGPYSASPDIWIAGLNPVPNYQTALATDQSYGSASASNVYSGQSNYIYVRGKNGATTNKTNNVSLYYAPSGVIQSPSSWQDNVIPTDTGQPKGNISNLAPATIGVCDATFVWKHPDPPPPGSDHYCLFAQFNDANNSNPFPDVETALDMGALIMNNLGWGWRNTSMIPSTPSWSYTEPLNIPDDYATTQTYSVFVTPVGFVGWTVEFYCSRADARGNPIRLNKSTITQDGQILGVSTCVLDPGFQSLITVNVYSPNGQTPTPGATMPLSCTYVASAPQELREAIARNLIDWNFMHRFRRAFPELMVTPKALIIQGAYSWTVTKNPAVRAYWEHRR